MTIAPKGNVIDISKASSMGSGRYLVTATSVAAAQASDS